ncbi:MAG TPA: hypothetical protein VFY71_13880 [Planctomycetota bacterium]|nr:hypothetical protein [Planctomycetota bacterium]
MLTRLVRLAPVVLLAACASPSDDPAPSAPPPAWSLTFEYQPGYTDDGIWWIVTVPWQGLCHIEARHWRRTYIGDDFDPTDEMRARLYASLEAARFRELAEVRPGGSDCERMTLTFEDERGTHVVRVADPTGVLAWLPENRNEEYDEVRRFMSVVVELLRITGSPESRQTPEMFERLMRSD